MGASRELPFPVIDALQMGAHRVFALTDERLFAQCGVRVAFTGREGGVSEGPFASLNCGYRSGDDDGAVGENRQRVCASLGVRVDAQVSPQQVHGTDFLEVSCLADAKELQRGLSGEDAPVGDGMLVAAANVAGLLVFADCLPLVIVSPTGHFAVVHAGWRGAIAHIARKGAELLATKDDVDPREFNAYIGPHIRSGCFEVGADVASAFEREFGCDVMANPRHVSLAQAVSIDLADAGLESRRIADARVCTKCHSDEYFSYRATSGACGRHAAVAIAVG